MGNEIERLINGEPSVVIGKLTREIIAALGIKHDTCDIIMWADRLVYIEKHRDDFKCDFDKQVLRIPDIIASPDYVGIHPGKNSIEYIKRIDELIIVAVRLKEYGNLAFRSMYPLTEKQLSDYLRYGTVIKL